VDIETGSGGLIANTQIGGGINLTSMEDLVHL
jgi:hypothetical protein